MLVSPMPATNPNPPTHVLLCRHGQTDANANGIVQGHLPTPLNATGLEQSRRLAERLARYEPKLTRLVSSPLVRAVQTAGPLAATLALPASEDPRWTERDFGSASGKPADIVRIMTHGQPSPVAPDDAEPRDSFDARVRHALTALPPGEVTAVVTHGGVIGSVLRQILDGRIPTTNPPADRSQVPNCSITHLRRDHPAGPWTIVRLCDASHEHELRTTTDAG
jgi:probable phosphoglycerate mutase